MPADDLPAGMLPKGCANECSLGPPTPKTPAADVVDCSRQLLQSELLDLDGHAYHLLSFWDFVLKERY